MISISAIDLNKGEIVWQIAHGETPDDVRNHPALKGLNIPRTGRQGRIGVLTTKTLVIAGEGTFFTTPSGQRGAMLRAYDKATGQEVGAVLHASAADRIANDVHAQWQAISGRRHRWRYLQRRIARPQTSLGPKTGDERSINTARR